MKNRFCSLIICGALLLNVTYCQATTERIKADYHYNWSEFESLQKSVPGLAVLKGEIVGIDHAAILINSFNKTNGIDQFKLNRDTKFFCNGFESQWQALTPVAPGAFFEAQVLVNGQKDVIAVNAFYDGEECVIRSCYQNQGRLVVEVISVYSEEILSYPVNQDARLPSSDIWRQEGQVVYILYNGREEIRAVFLPD